MSDGAQTVAAEALFGSAARRDGDQYSDTDYLIVDDNYALLSARKAWLTARGFSVSDYTHKRLRKAFCSGTLFAMHLRREARVVVDRDQRLAELFQSYQPKVRYLDDFDNSLELLRPLEAIPRSQAGRGWALDLLAVAFRNSAILALADEGQYVFSIRQVVGELQRRGRVTKAQAATLCSLRRHKARYRSMQMRSASQTILDEGLRAVSAGLGVDFGASMRGATQIIAWGADSTFAYSAVRRVEAELLTVPRRVTQDARAAQTFERLWRAVRDPHAYLWQFVHRQVNVQEDLRLLRAHY